MSVHWNSKFHIMSQIFWLGGKSSISASNPTENIFLFFNRHSLRFFGRFIRRAIHYVGLLNWKTFVTLVETWNFIRCIWCGIYKSLKLEKCLLNTCYKYLTPCWAFVVKFPFFVDRLYVLKDNQHFCLVAYSAYKKIYFIRAVDFKNCY